MMASAGYIDLQVNGYAGVDFNADDLTLDAMSAVARRLRDDGVQAILATIITADATAMAARLRRIVEARNADPLVRDVIRGLHIEGPFINREVGFVGAHPVEHVLPATVEAIDRLLDAADGLTRIVTLAPECDAGFRVTRHLAERGIAVSAGHCDPALDTLRGAIDAGLSMFTHLGNGCPLLMHRHDNIIQRALSLSDCLWITFIADGAHVPWPTLRNYVRLVGVDRAIVVSDATSAAGMGPGNYTIGGVEAIVGADLVPRLAHDPRYFAGSALTMRRAAENLAQHLALNSAEIDKLCAANARQAMRW